MKLKIISINYSKFISINSLNNLYINGETSFNFEIHKNALYIIFSKYLPISQIINEKNDIILPSQQKKYRLSGQHEQDIVTINYINEKQLDLDKFNFFLSVLLPRYGADLYRYKGILYLNNKKKIFFNGVHEIFDYEIKPVDDNEQRINRIVFIGKNITEDKTLRGIENCFN